MAGASPLPKPRASQQKSPDASHSDAASALGSRLICLTPSPPANSGDDSARWHRGGRPRMAPQLFGWARTPFLPGSSLLVCEVNDGHGPGPKGWRQSLGGHRHACPGGTCPSAWRMPPPPSLVPSDLALEHFVGLGTRTQGTLLALDPQAPSRVRVGAAGRVCQGHRLLEDLPTVCPHSWFPEQSQIGPSVTRGGRPLGGGTWEVSPGPHPRSPIPPGRETSGRQLPGIPGGRKTPAAANQLFFVKSVSSISRLRAASLVPFSSSSGFQAPLSTR